MGYLISKQRESQFLTAVNNHIQEHWQRIYQDDIKKAYPKNRLDIWHRYLQFCKDRGLIYEFYTIGKFTRREIVSGLFTKVYYFDFAVSTRLGMILDDVWTRPLPMKNLEAIWALRNFDPIRIITTSFIKDVMSAYPDVDFSHQTFNPEWENHKTTYNHFR